MRPEGSKRIAELERGGRSSIDGRRRKGCSNTMAEEEEELFLPRLVDFLCFPFDGDNQQ